MSLTLRPVEPRDLPALFAHQADPASSAMAAVASRDRDAFDAHWARILADPAALAYAAVEDGEVVGSVVSWPDGERRWVGYWVGRAHWGRGIATAALRAFLAEVSDRPLHATVADHNDASRRVLEKCGFVPDGPPRREGDGVVLLPFRLDAA